MLDIEREFPGSNWWLGTVINRDDPEGLGRVKARIPGKTDETDWAYPAGMMAAAKRGSPDVPPLGARVVMTWIGGDINNMVVYLPGIFHRGWMPTGHAVNSDGGDNFVRQNDRLRVEVDTRDSSAGIRITNLDESGATDQAGTAVVIDVDLVSAQVRIATTLGLKLESVGAIEIEGGSIALNGRVVSPGGKPL